MVNDSMRSDKLIGMIQPKNSKDQNDIPKLHDVGCLGKITSFRETEDGRYLIELKGLIRFKIINNVFSSFAHDIWIITKDLYTNWTFKFMEFYHV